MAINALAPFAMNSEFVELMALDSATATTKTKTTNTTTASSATARRAPPNRPLRRPKFIVNVSAMEGKFYRRKSSNHPHTNMAKAALNMMTRTCAADLATRGIYMTSVDTGACARKKRKHKQATHCPGSIFCPRSPNHPTTKVNVVCERVCVRACACVRTRVPALAGWSAVMG